MALRLLLHIAVNTTQKQRVAHRDEIGGLFRPLNRSDDGGLKNRPFFYLLCDDCLKGPRAHGNHPAGSRFAHRRGLLGDIDHLGAVLIVQMR